MTKVRYKIRKEQLERVVENFVMESAMIEKNAAKKHKMSMGDEQADDMGEGMEKAKEVKKAKMKQAPEVKKHIKGTVSESEIKKAAKHYNITEGEVERRLELLREFDEGAFMQKLNNLATGLIRKGYINRDKADNQKESIKKEASKENYEGDVKFKKDKSGEYIMYYVPLGKVPDAVKKKSILQRFGMTGSGAKA
jgi:hypothetical protein